VKKPDLLLAAQYCFEYMLFEKADPKYWEARMYEYLFEWAGYKK
jgi:hypothetical protein